MIARFEPFELVNYDGMTVTYLGMDDYDNAYIELPDGTGEWVDVDYLSSIED